MDTTLDELEGVAHEIATVLAEEGNARAVFGPPMKLDTHTIIPVASVAMGGGLGGVSALGAAVRKLRKLFSAGVDVQPSRSLAGGGGGGIDVRPVGYLSEEDGHVVFTRIDVQR